MSYAQLAHAMRPVIEAELKRQVHRLAAPSTTAFQAMLVYHLGWDSRSANIGGKRIRPILSLLVCASTGGSWRDAVPAAAGLELVHNFSLVHDDIQDNSPTRRGRLTLWRTQGVPLAINAGDAMFTLANQAALDLAGKFDGKVVVEAVAVLQQACLDLTKGQFLDLYHQQKGSLTIKDYWRMIEGKTAALIAACTHIGALLGGASPAKRAKYHKFGKLLGLAFQVEDDILGIWGEENRTGKSAASDLVEGKLSLPVIYGLGKNASFAELWRRSATRKRNAARLRKYLEDEGGREYATAQAVRLTRNALRLLHELHPRGEAGKAGKALEELTLQLLARRA